MGLDRDVGDNLNKVDKNWRNNGKRGLIQCLFHKSID